MTNLPDLAALPALAIWEGVAARAVHGGQSTLAVVELDPGSEVGEHQHTNEQLGLVLAGSVEFTVGAETRALGPGGMWRIPPDTPHRARAGSDGAVVIDVFAPGRDDWADKPPQPARAPRWP